MSFPQRKTPGLAELCIHVVKDMYGDIAARVFSVLARLGRKRSPEISQASYLTPQQVRYGLVLLVQQHLVFRSIADSPATFYDVDWRQSYALLRNGKASFFVEAKMGKKAANVVSNLLSLGHTSVGDLRDAYFPPGHTNESNGALGDSLVTNGADVAKTNGSAARVNGDHSANSVKTNGQSHAEQNSDPNEMIASPQELESIIQDLIRAGWVIQVAEAQYLSEDELHLLARQRMLDEVFYGSTPTSANDKLKLKTRTMEEKRRIRDAWLLLPQSMSMKRKANDRDYENPSKRVKREGAGHYDRVGGSDEDDLVIRVNPEKVAVAMRHHQLVQLIEERLGYTTSRIFDIILDTVEKDTRRCFEDYPNPYVPPKKTRGGEEIVHDPVPTWINFETRDVVRKIESLIRRQALDFDLCEGLDLQLALSIIGTGTLNEDNSFSNSVDSSQLSSDQLQRLVEAHLHMLYDDPFHFANWRSRGQWQINWEELSKNLIVHVIETTLRARDGVRDNALPAGTKDKDRLCIGLTTVRALKRRGRLDDRRLATVTMNSSADMRGIVTDLATQGFIQTQEIPRVDRREAKLSHHLVWFDLQRCRERLLQDTYKGQIRILQRLAMERQRVRPVLTKSERSDVVGKENKYLSQDELGLLRKWEQVQRTLLLQLCREDDVVATLRDFIGPVTSS